MISLFVLFALRFLLHMSSLQLLVFVRQGGQAGFDTPWQPIWLIERPHNSGAQ